MIAIGFSTTASLLSRTVRWFTKSKASHSFIMFDWLEQQWVVEAEAVGVQIVPLSNFLARKNIIVKTYELPNITMEDLKLVLQDSGTGYDYTGLFGAILPIIGQWFKQKWHNPWNNAKALFCSEMIAQWLKDLELPVADNLISEDITPEKLWDFLESNLDSELFKSHV